MTFGNYRWGSQDDEARQIFEGYTEAGGNFIDTADGYAVGKSEELTGAYIRDMNLRDRVVLATKFTFNTSEGNPNAGGNGRKNIHRALEGSLRRLGTDYIDLYWMHAWDMVTPFDEVVKALSDLVRQGKIRYYGFSDVPAWYAARAVTYSEYTDRERPICPATRVFAGRAHNRTRAYSSGPGAWYGCMPLEPPGKRLSG
jgi:aryl-alcohol dehydrogenase-like predicted oxidoreductase